jgi:hydroxyethylthiazole kinase-like uncharacterized protein yjeF
MVALFTAAQMRAADLRAAETGLPGLWLMENAGGAVASVAAHLPVLRDGPGTVPGGVIVILVGTGNNGGDGLVAARLLVGRGFRVEVILAGPEESFSGDALVNLRALTGLTGPGGSLVGGPRVFGGADSDKSETSQILAGASVIIDALLGTATKGPPREPTAALIRLCNQAASPGPRPMILSVDLPSGLDPDTGQAPDPCVRADATVTLGGVKLGLASPGAADYTGRLYLAPIGLPGSCLPAPAAEWLLPGEAGLHLPARPREGHKGTFGHIWIVAGSPGYTGAAVLAGLGALRSGVGLATVASPRGGRDLIASALPELVTLALPEDPDGRLRAGAAGDLSLAVTAVGAAPAAVTAAGHGRPKAGRASLVVGPGLGATAEVAAFVVAIAGNLGRDLPIVLDADALNALALSGPAAAGRSLSGMTSPIAGEAGPAPASPEAKIIITPHPGEMSRLTGLSTAAIQADRLGAARRAAAAWGVIVVLKGAGTVIACPDGRAWINATGNPGLATAGSGDVLSGVIGALLAQGCPPRDAALVGVSVHGLAGDLAARDIGRRGLLARDVADRLPRAFDLMSAPELLSEYGLERLTPLPAAPPSPRPSASPRPLASPRPSAGKGQEDRYESGEE